MQSDYWNDFYETGKVSDYLKYAGSARNTADGNREYAGKDETSFSMESVKYAGKSDGNGSFGKTSW